MVLVLIFTYRRNSDSNKIFLPRSSGSIVCFLVSAHGVVTRGFFYLTNRKVTYFFVTFLIKIRIIKCETTTRSNATPAWGSILQSTHKSKFRLILNKGSKMKKVPEFVTSKSGCRISEKHFK